MKEKVFLVHGIFAHAMVMTSLRHRLIDCGYDVYSFSYRSVRREMGDNAERLVDFVKANSETDIPRHFVGHSLGGLLIRLAYELSPDCFNGRIVTLGTPHNGSLVAERLVNNVHDNVLGGAYEDALDGDLPAWTGAVELGSIAGNTPVGIGLIIPDLEKPNDGTVTVRETQLPNQTDHIELPLSHTALIYSKRAAAQVDAFLRHGRFLHAVNNE